MLNKNYSGPNISGLMCNDQPPASTFMTQLDPHFTIMTKNDPALLVLPLAQNSQRLTRATSLRPGMHPNGAGGSLPRAPATTGKHLTGNAEPFNRLVLEALILFSSWGVKPEDHDEKGARATHTVRPEGQLSDAASLPTRKARTAHEHPGPSARPLRRGSRAPTCLLAGAHAPRSRLLCGPGSIAHRRARGGPAGSGEHAAWSAASPNSE